GEERGQVRHRRVGRRLVGVVWVSRGRERREAQRRRHRAEIGASRTYVSNISSPPFSPTKGKEAAMRSKPLHACVHALVAAAAVVACAEGSSLESDIGPSSPDERDLTSGPPQTIPPSTADAGRAKDGGL